MAPESTPSRVVRVLSSTMVQPASPTPTDPIWLSNLDLGAGRRSYTPTIYLFRRPTGVDSKDFFNVETLKASLARTLVKFYPYAGKLAPGDDAQGGRIELQATGEGVRLVVAECECEIDEFGDFAPSQDLRKQLCPFQASADPPCPVFMFQVTYFRCGGVCLGTAGHHMIGDGLSSLYFINSWAAITRGVDPDTIAPPQLDRTVLRARDPPLIEYEHDQHRACFKDLGPAPTPTAPPPTVATAILRISKDQVAKLKGGRSAIVAAAAASRRPVSTFTAVVAHAWRCMCKARGLGGDESTRLFIAADVRDRLAPPLPHEFLGNAILFMPAESLVGELVSSPLESVADIINKSKENLHDRFLRSLIDFLEQQEGPMRGPWALPATDLYAVSWLRLPVYEADFGWGKPGFMGRAGLPYRGRIYIQRSPQGDGAVLVTVAIEESFMATFKKVFYADMDFVY